VRPCSIRIVDHSTLVIMLGATALINAIGLDVFCLHSMI
jgi:hypothetical protein